MQYEEDVGTTSWRHTHSAGLDGPHLDALRKLDLVIRTVSTVGNYGTLKLIYCARHCSEQHKCSGCKASLQGCGISVSGTSEASCWYNVLAMY